MFVIASGEATVYMEDLEQMFGGRKQLPTWLTLKVCENKTFIKTDFHSLGKV